MVETLLANQEEEKVASEQTRTLAELLRPDLLIDGHEPEQRIVYNNLSWKRYLDLDKALGADRPSPRFYYLDGDLEIMTTSEEHERIKKWIGRLLEMYLEDVLDVELTMRGQATLRLEPAQAGAEPDESYSFGEKKEFPDLVLEIALTSGGVKKLELYRRFAVPEVWFWRKGKLEIHALPPDGSGYEQVRDASRLLPGLDIALVERCVAIDNWREARRVFRAGLAARGQTA